MKSDHQQPSGYRPFFPFTDFDFSRLTYAEGRRLVVYSHQVQTNEPSNVRHGFTHADICLSDLLICKATGGCREAEALARIDLTLFEEKGVLAMHYLMIEIGLDNYPYPELLPAWLRE